MRFAAREPDGLGEVAIPVGAGGVEDEDFFRGHMIHCHELKNIREIRVIRGEKNSIHVYFQ